MPIRFASKPGLVAYLTVGDPDLATTHNIAIAAIDAGADVLELGELRVGKSFGDHVLVRYSRGS